MSEFLSPFCAGLVIADSSTDGHCALCGLHHRRRAGADVWGYLVGPLTATLSGATIGTGTAPRNLCCSMSCRSCPQPPRRSSIAAAAAVSDGCTECL